MQFILILLAKGKEIPVKKHIEKGNLHIKDVGYITCKWAYMKLGGIKLWHNGKKSPLTKLQRILFP